MSLREELSRLVPHCKQFYTHLSTPKNPICGKFYMALTEFPGALFDDNGFAVFQTADEFRSPYINPTKDKFGNKKINIPTLLSGLPQYQIDDRVTEIVKRYRGTAQPTRLRREIHQKEKPEPEKIVKLPEIYIPLIQRIESLMNDGSHQERDHESIVERFFEVLGYKPDSEIKFRRGRIDILIYEQNNPLVTIEVKRDWGISSKSLKYIKQAFHYALEQGIRFVIITNGDNYVVYDRNKQGMSYQHYLLFEFQLTRITEVGLNNISILKKGKLSTV
jgi:hypothetical protein